MNLKELDNFNYKCDFCVIADTLHHIGNGVENIDNLSKLLDKLKKLRALCNKRPFRI